MKREHKEMMKARARNICLTVAYDGTGYHGFQRQSPPIRAVQNVLEEKLTLVFGDTIELAAAGRTDAGVHAVGQVVNFFTDGRIPTERIVRAMNSVLPPDIVVKAAREEGRSFSARHSAKSKSYIYRIQEGETPNPFSERYAWYVGAPLDLASMNEAAAHMIGKHDFSAFRAAGGAPMLPVRTMYRAEGRRIEGERIEFVFHANGFLYHMARNIVGTLVDVGRGRRTAADFAAILEGGDRKCAAATAPACGLFLESVEY